MSGLNQRFTKPSSLKQDRGFESHSLRQLGNVFVGSPSARARQPILSAKQESYIFAPKGLAKSGLPEFSFLIFKG